jgi:hypothetical protein
VQRILNSDSSFLIDSDNLAHGDGAGFTLSAPEILGSVDVEVIAAHFETDNPNRQDRLPGRIHRYAP